MPRVELSAERASHFVGCAHIAITDTFTSKLVTTARAADQSQSPEVVVGSR